MTGIRPAVLEGDAPGCTFLALSNEDGRELRFKP